MKAVGKTLVCAFALILGTVFGGAIVPALHIQPPAMPPGAAPNLLFAWSLVGALVLAVCMVPLAAGLGGRLVNRYLALGGLLFIANAVNSAIEMTIFSTMGGQAFIVAHFFIVFVIGALALAGLFGSQQPLPSWPHKSASAWAWRIVVAWLAFPVIYLLFGMCVGPFVIEYYKSGALGLTLPPMDVILRTQAVRSLLFLGCSLPVIRLWTGSRWRLVFALGLAHAGMVGLYGLSQAYWMPAIMRVLHSVEIIFDSFAYALVLTWLFFPRTETADARLTPAHVTSATPA